MRALKATFGYGSQQRGTRNHCKFRAAGFDEGTLLSWRAARNRPCQCVRTSMQLGNSPALASSHPLDNWFPLTSLSRLPLKRRPRTANWRRAYSSLSPIFPCFSAQLSSLSSFFLLHRPPLPLPATVLRFFLPSAAPRAARHAHSINRGENDAPSFAENYTGL